MAYDGWMTFGGTELFNLHRTAALAAERGLSSVWADTNALLWIGEALGDGGSYADIETAPWYNPRVPASSEFVGLVPVSVSGLEDSTLSAETTENIVDGGNTAKSRNGSLSIVVSAYVVASTERGAAYGKEWLSMMLAGANPVAPTYCAGAELSYFPGKPRGDVGVSLADVKHRRDVRATRGISVTKKVELACEHLWALTFTLTADDPYEYGESIFGAEQVVVLDPAGTYTLDSEVFVNGRGDEEMTQQSCPVYDYSPLQDPDFPTTTLPPSPPDFYPSGWAIENGASFTRYWTRIEVHGSWVPVFRIAAPAPMRNVRLSVWPGISAVDDQCDPLFSVVLTYVPESSSSAGSSLFVDGETKAVYAWDGLEGTLVRRAEAFAYSEDASPVGWGRITGEDEVLVTVDVFDPPVGASILPPLVALYAVPKSF